MAMNKRVGLLAALAMIAGSQSGCLVVSTAGGSWGIGLGGSWQTATSEMTIEMGDLSGLDVRTLNGRVTYTGGTSAVVSVSAKKTGTGLTLGDAQAALDAIDVYVEDVGSGRKKLAWRWSTPKHSTWNGGVSFTISGPANLGVDVETHNGRVEIGGVAGDVKAVTHNGSVIASSSGGALVVETHNGRIEADFTGSSISLATSNGGVDADLSGCGAVEGTITTNNGAVRVTVGTSTVADIECETHNGGIHADDGVDVQTSSRHRLVGTVGAGGPPLKVLTHNGGIRLKKTG